MTSDGFFNFATMMSRAAAEPYMPDFHEPITAKSLIDSAITHLRLVEDRLAIPLYSSIDDPIDEQNTKVAADCCQTAIEKLEQAKQLLPTTE